MPDDELRRHTHALAESLAGPIMFGLEMAKASAGGPTPDARFAVYQAIINDVVRQWDHPPHQFVDDDKVRTWGEVALDFTEKSLRDAHSLFFLAEEPWVEAGREPDAAFAETLQHSQHNLLQVAGLPDDAKISLLATLGVEAAIDLDTVNEAYRHPPSVDEPVLLSARRNRLGWHPELLAWIRASHQKDRGCTAYNIKIQFGDEPPTRLLNYFWRKLALGVYAPE